MPAPQAVGAVVPVGRSERVIRHVEPAVTAAERVGSSSLTATSVV
jgi:hypothetical protein